MSQAEVLEQLRLDLEAAHDEDLGKQPGHVWILFTDGEISMTKSGSLLWQRGLHCIHPGVPDLKLPVDLGRTMRGYGFIFTTEDVAKGLARRIYEFFGQEPYYSLRSA